MKKYFPHIIDTALVVLGIFSAGMGVKGFLLSSHFIDGGVTGVSMLLSVLLGIPIAVLILLINLPFIFLGLRQMGYQFAIKSALAIVGLSLCLAFVHFPDMTHDKLLTAVFGGFFLGLGIGLAIRGGAVLDGTEIAALHISRSGNQWRVGDVILLFNVCIFTAAAFFLGVESAMYSILTYMAASKTMDFLIHGLEEYNAIVIISTESELIKHCITERLNRSVTTYKGQGGSTSRDQDILYCVVTRLEIGSIKKAVREIDPYAFIAVNPLASAEGGSIPK